MDISHSHTTLTVHPVVSPSGCGCLSFSPRHHQLSLIGLCLWLQDQITALGPWGGALFVLTVMLAEMVPLFPTQPLTLASGLLFGPVKVRKQYARTRQMLQSAAATPSGAAAAAAAAVAVGTLISVHSGRAQQAWR
jgi:hypothetical protein